MSEQPPVGADKATATPSNASTSANGASVSGAGAEKALPKQNPALKAMGLPRFRLPSRNWMIFLGITGSFTSAILYDRWQTRKVKEKWCKLVSHIADEPLDTKILPRKLTIYLSAPPGDGLRAAREHFHNYVKPILVSAAIDWDVVEGRKEGDVRYKTAERIRRRRRGAGEGKPLEAEEAMIAQIRSDHGFNAYPGVAGDLVIGRHTWKEYIRGMHEGWLGPSDMPAGHPESMLGPVVKKPVTEEKEAPVDALAGESTPDAASPPDTESSGETAAEATPKEEKKEDEKKEEEAPKPRQPPPLITPEHYSESTGSKILPELLDPTAPVSCPHILGFRNTPIRLYRYLTRRRLADDIGRQVASAILGQYRAYGVNSVDADSSPSAEATTVPEQEQVLIREERDWWKTVRQPRKEHEESVLIEPMYFDERITGRMRQFQLTAEDEDRAKRIALEQEPASSDV